MAEIPVLSSVPEVSEEDEAKILAQALRSITHRLVALEAEQKALDANMVHIAQALQAVIEAAAEKMGMQA